MKFLNFNKIKKYSAFVLSFVLGVSPLLFALMPLAAEATWYDAKGRPIPGATGYTQINGIYVFTNSAGTPIVDYLGDPIQNPNLVSLKNPTGALQPDSINTTADLTALTSSADSLTGTGAAGDNNVGSGQTNINGSGANGPTGCESATTGGSLGGASSELGSFLNKTLPGQLESILRGNASHLIGTLTGNSAVGQAIGSLLNGATPGDIAQGLIQNATGGNPYLSILGQFAGGVIDKYFPSVSSIFSGIFGGGATEALKSAVETAKGIATGVAGTALSTIAGGLGPGAGPIEVNDAANLKENTGTNKNTGTQVHVLCVERPMIAGLSNDAAAQYADTVIKECATENGGDTCWSQDPEGEAGKLAYTIHKDVVNNQLPNLINGQPNAQYLQYAQQRAVADRQQATDPSTQFDCKNITVDVESCLKDFGQCGKNYNEQITNYSNIFWYGCTPTQTAEKAANLSQAEEASGVQYRNQKLVAANGLVPKTQCLDDNGANNPDYQCAHGKIVVAPHVEVTTLDTAVGVGAEKQAHATELGQMVDSLFAQLAQQALTSLTGMLSYTQNSSDGSGSYLDQATGGTTAAALTQAQSALQNDIEASIGNELIYENVLNDMITNLNNAKTAEVNLQACLAHTTLGTIGSSTPQAAASQASSTISSIIQPLIDEKNTDLSNSQNALTQLDTLDTQVQNAQSATDLNALSAEYQALISSGALHTTNDVAFLTNDRDSSKVTLDGITANANVLLSQCH